MDYNELIEGLIDTNKAYRKASDKHRLSISPVFYAIEFCTITCDIGRGVGKTTFIKNHAKKGDLVIVVNIEAKRNNYGMNTEYDVITMHELDRVRGRRFQTIYIDEPALVFNNDVYRKNDVYQTLTNPFEEQTFVLLGR